MTLEQTTAIVRELTQKAPFSHIKVEVTDHGWYYLYVWTGSKILFYVAPTLPAALVLMAKQLHEQYGKEI